MSVTSTPDGVALIEFAAAHEHNPFSRARMRELRRLVEALDADDQAGCLILYGGAGRSFGAGGDFNEVSAFRGGPEVDAWIDDITDLYQAVAGIRKPVVAAVDGYAIGIGLQIALCCDYRIGSTRSRLAMPEFQVGIACNFGGFMLEAVAGRAVMQDMLFTAAHWEPDRARADRLLHQVAEPDQVLPRAREAAARIAGWTAAAVRSTRPRINASFVAGLERLRVEGKQSHRAAFAAGEAQQRMRHILGQG